MWRKHQNSFTFRQFHDPDGKKNEYLLINNHEAATIDVSTACDQNTTMRQEAWLNCLRSH